MAPRRRFHKECQGFSHPRGRFQKGRDRPLRACEGFHDACEGFHDVREGFEHACKRLHDACNVFHDVREGFEHARERLHDACKVFHDVREGFEHARKRLHDACKVFHDVRSKASHAFNAFEHARQSLSRTLERPLNGRQKTLRGSKKAALAFNEAAHVFSRLWNTRKAFHATGATLERPRQASLNAGKRSLRRLKRA